MRIEKRLLGRAGVHVPLGALVEFAEVVAKVFDASAVPKGHPVVAPVVTISSQRAEDEFRIRTYPHHVASDSPESESDSLTVRDLSGRFDKSFVTGRLSGTLLLKNEEGRLDLVIPGGPGKFRASLTIRHHDAAVADSLADKADEFLKKHRSPAVGALVFSVFAFVVAAGGLSLRSAGVSTDLSWDDAVGGAVAWSVIAIFSAWLGTALLPSSVTIPKPMRLAEPAMPRWEPSPITMNRLTVISIVGSLIIGAAGVAIAYAALR